MADDENEVVGGTTRKVELCSVEMHLGRLCDRPIHTAPPGIDERPVCLMHSQDPDKRDEEFQAEFWRIRRDAGVGIADLTRVVFPRSLYRTPEFKAECVFNEAEFPKNVLFTGRFQRTAHFSGAYFAHAAKFGSVAFNQGVDFSKAVFMQEVNFGRATLATPSNFNEATLTREANFEHAVFGYIGFKGATFAQDVNFNSSTFAGVANFEQARFAGAAEFRQVRFEKAPLGGGHPSPVFANTRFEKPEKVAFYKINLSWALLHNCDVSRINFSDVTWRKRKNGKCMVYDEEVDLDVSVASALRPASGDPNPRNYRLIAELYQQLKKNYDERRDYWTADEFHYGEMEMKRLYSPRRNKVLRWLHRNAGLVAWYKYANAYGQSYVRAVVWLLLIIAAFAFAYPGAGLCTKQFTAAGSSNPHCEADEVFVSYPSVVGAGGKDLSWVNKAGPLVAHGAMTTLYVAAFQKDLTYRPSYPLGRFLALAEVLLTSTLSALFLLAVRRQFKR